jgi:DNA-binding response OmpR family regulator
MTDGVNSLAPNQQGGSQAPTSSDKKTVLLIEDDPFLVKMYKEKFEVEGFNTLIAEDGLEGLRLATTQNIDIIILDILIPKLSGIDLLTRLRKDPKGVSIPVLVLTNLTQKEDEVKTASMGVKEYLVKSDYTPSQVVEKVRMYLGQPHT